MKIPRTYSKYVILYNGNVYIYKFEVQKSHELKLSLIRAKNQLKKCFWTHIMTFYTYVEQGIPY